MQNDDTTNEFIKSIVYSYLKDNLKIETLVDLKNDWYGNFSHYIVTTKVLLENEVISESVEKCY